MKANCNKSDLLIDNLDLDGVENVLGKGKITLDHLRGLGVDDVARMAGCINVNYLFRMNGLMLEPNRINKIKSRVEAKVKSDFEAYIGGVMDTLNGDHESDSLKYLKQSYIEWFAPITK